MALVLPDHVAFKGDNGKYLSACWIEGHPYLMFSASDITDNTVGQVIVPNPDGSIRIKSVYHGRFWRRSPNWIWADNSSDTSADRDTVFWPVKVGDNVIALRNSGNNFYCKRLTTEGKTSCLNAAVPNITPEARLVVEELVMSRTISNVNYRLNEIRYYGKEIFEVGHSKAVNDSDRPSTETMTFTYTETQTTSWNNSMSFKLGVKTTIKTGIPFIVDGKVEVSGEVTKTTQFGETTTKTVTIANAYTVTVAPHSSMTVAMMVTKGSYDIPFSYTQTDILFDGSVKTYYKNDGIYTGNSALDFTFENSEPVGKFKNTCASIRGGTRIGTTLKV